MARSADYEPEGRCRPPPDDLRLRSAALPDVPALAALRVERGDAGREQAVAAFEDLLARGALVLLAESEGCVVGYGTVEHLLRAGLPGGWYLGGLIVAQRARRRGVGARLTRERLDWIRARSAVAHYFVNESNRASIDLHAAFGFALLERDLQVPGIPFTGGAGLLYRAAL